MALCRALCVLLVATWSLTSVAQLRTLPASAQRADFVASTFPLVLLDGTTFRLAPGARIYNENNVTVTPNLVPPHVTVKYQRDAQGMVQTVWMLTPQERAAP